jgi:hypothetical protein
VLAFAEAIANDEEAGVKRRSYNGDRDPGPCALQKCQVRGGHWSNIGFARTRLEREAHGRRLGTRFPLPAEVDGHLVRERARGEGAAE